MKLPSDADRSGRDLGEEELKRLGEVIESGTLTSTKGTAVKQFEARFAERWGVGFCRATASGTAAVHTAVAAVDPEPGDEIVTTPITDFGAISPILYQTAVPVFADVDPTTWNVTAETLAARIGPRTRALVVTHLFGNPCEMDGILALAERHGLPVIEDAAQAYGAEWDGRPAGALGDVGCFSLQQGKHMTTGEGGVVVARNPAFERRLRLFVDKAWGYGDPRPDHDFLALNYRMSELQGAVALAQLEKLEVLVERRIRAARGLAERIAGIDGVHAPAGHARARHAYWKFPLRIDARAVAGGVDGFSTRLRERGIASAPRYVEKPAFLLRCFRERNTFGGSGFPFEGPHRAGLPPVVYDPDDYPGALEGLAHLVVLPINEFYEDAHLDHLARCIREAAEGREGTGG